MTSKCAPLISKDIGHISNKAASENPKPASARQSKEEVKYGQMVFDQAVDNLPRS